ncbi:MAG TPA: Hsp20/alpha crystallin family protein, partial [Dehalococcoidales bacterium]|nr:Hsp20/alpha crystallin family protein [Dehalococcoidales bacterium]
MTVERWRPSRAVTRMHPFRDFDELENRFEEYFGRPIWLSEERLNWMPPIDIYEKGDKYIVKAELPGMKEEDIKVSIIDNTLQIKGEKKSE